MSLAGERGHLAWWLPRLAGLRLTLRFRSLAAHWGWLRFVLLALVVLLALGWIGLAGTGYEYRPLEASDLAFHVPGGSRDEPSPSQASKENSRLKTRLARAEPRGNYIVVDRSNNRLYLMKDGQVVLDARCSAGSGIVLRDGERSWRFETPSGRFRVLSKTKSPVWRKPDWAFREEGKPVPKNAADRIEYGTLGEYALHFGNGYMIHGTLYEILLGRSVTHGCIRLGRQDLAQVFRSAPVGTPIYIF
jgi:L,D-transpeptidase YbiS